MDGDQQPLITIIRLAFRPGAHTTLDRGSSAFPLRAIAQARNDCLAQLRPFARCPATSAPGPKMIRQHLHQAVRAGFET